MKKLLIFYFVFFFFSSAIFIAANPIEKAFSALREYDYFLARKSFYKILRKSDNTYAGYGLALIYSRKDNPFFNEDSASKYINFSFAAFIKQPVKKELSGFIIDSVHIRILCDSIALRSFSKVIKRNSIEQIEHFLNANYLASKALISKALAERDELEFNEVIKKNRSDSTLIFIYTHPESDLLGEAILLRQRQQYDELTKKGRAEDFKKFISSHPNNIMVKEAYENLFRIYREKSDAAGLRDFVKSYPKAPQINEAWKLLFSLTVKTFSNKELEKFLKEYPDFPFRNSIQKELELNKLVLFPYEKSDLYGFIDSSGKFIIKPQFESATAFTEGLALVNRNDSVFYINKENKNPFGEFFSEAYEFKNGISAVKKNGRWFFINRQGQIISSAYEEINESSSQIYVVKQNGKYGAVNPSAQTIIEPRFQKLGDFKNDIAYYTEGGKYGFVSKNGSVYKAVYDWISEFNDQKAIVKIGDQYGIINSYGYSILDPEYDLILRAPNNLFVIVKNGQYGFYSGNACFISPVSYDFIKEKPADYYTNGTLFRLIRKGSQALMDANGKILVDFDNFEEVNFTANNLLRVKKNKKYGYADKKLNIVIPLKYSEAGDFSDGTAIVEIKDRIALINLSGKELFSTEEKFEKLSAHYFLEGEEEDRNLINNKGEKVLSSIADVQRAGNNTFIITLKNGEIKLISD